MTDGQNTRDQITSDRRSKRAWSKCVLCIPYIRSGSPNLCWLHTRDACVITTWRLGLWAPPVVRNYFHIQHDWKNWHISYIFKIFFLMSTSFSTIRSSNCWILKSFRLRAVLHSGHAADGRVKRVSTQLSHLSEQKIMWDKITCREITIMETNKKKTTWRKTHQRETTKSFEIFILLTRAYFYLKIVLPSVTYGLWLSWGFCKKTGLKELEKNHVLAAKSIWLVSLINNSKHSFGNSHLDARANWFSLNNL